MTRLSHILRITLTVVLAAVIGFTQPAPVSAAPYAAMVMDARNGKVYHARNADTRLHPASLTKMMTLYITFEAVRRGELSLDTRVKISKKAAAEPPSKLGLKAGQRIALRYLIRAAAVKSANDAATALAEAVSGSEAAFARRMNRTAKALGMKKSTFKNAHGLTESGHLSTARDMTILGRRLFHDYPDYYNLFSRQTTHAGVKQVSNTNRRLLSNYRGADGIKTGYTRAAGFNLVASAERGRERIIATVFGGRSTATRNARVAELLDMGFKRAPSRVATRKPSLPSYSAPKKKKKVTPKAPVAAVLAVKRSIRPRHRPVAAPSETLLLAVKESVDEVVKDTVTAEATPAPVAARAKSAPRARPIRNIIVATQAAPKALKLTTIAPTTIVKVSRPAETDTLADIDAGQVDADRVVVTRAGNTTRNWGITLGSFPSRHKAERVLLKTALKEIETLDEALRKVVPRNSGYEARFVGLSEDRAALACRRLTARGVDCTPTRP